jgi:hypothetical protein
LPGKVSGPLLFTCSARTMLSALWNRATHIEKEFSPLSLLARTRIRPSANQERWIHSCSEQLRFRLAWIKRSGPKSVRGAWSALRSCGTGESISKGMNRCAAAYKCTDRFRDSRILCDVHSNDFQIPRLSRKWQPREWCPTARESRDYRPIKSAIPV